MRVQNRGGPKLPAKLLEQVGGARPKQQFGGGYGKKPSSRAERRKAEREQKKQLKKQPRQKYRQPSPEDEDEDEDGAFDDELDGDEIASAPSVPATKSQPVTDDAKPVKSILKPARSSHVENATESKAQKASRGIKAKLDEDDAEIAALEKKLGMKGKKKLPKSFEDDGLAELLGGLDDGGSEDDSKKRKRTEDDEWLERKRRKASQTEGKKVAQKGLEEGSEDDDEKLDGFDEDGFGDLPSGSDEEGDDMELDGDEDGDMADEDDFESFDSEGDEDHVQEKPRVRENPYVAPVAASAAPAAKYIPPSMRKPAASDAESMSRLRRQIKGQLNRLSEANLLSILKEVEQFYQSNPRQFVTSTLIDILLELLCDPSTLQTTMIILHAGFIAAIYKAIGSDFGAQMVERIVSEFDARYATLRSGESDSKECSNLISLVAEMYNYQVIGSNLVFDYIRLFLNELSELNAELLLRIVRNSGPQLRQDDPSALKEIVLQLQKSVAEKGEANLSVRIKVMIDAINDLKNNKVKGGSVVSEHTIRMKKTLGSMNTRALKASEPLRISLKDIRDTEKKGKWWLVGASWRNEAQDQVNDEPKPAKSAKAVLKEREAVEQGTSDLVQLAREQRMNTDIRRAIFISIMSASDYRDAHVRLLKLKLKRAQELEIPRVLIHCAGAEQAYNPYYTLIARKLCSEHKLKMAFQFGLWEVFRRLGEKTDDADVDMNEDDDEALDMRKIVNLAKMFGNLVASGGLTISVLKILNFAYLQPKTKTFVEIMLITVILQTQKKSQGKKDKKALLDVFAKISTAPQMAAGLQYFLTKVVSASDLAGNKADRQVVKWGSGVAADALLDVMANGPAEDGEESE